jgi:hypothetical protein
MSALTRTEQLRDAKRAQRRRERDSGVVVVEMRLPENDARRLRTAVDTTEFRDALGKLLDETVLDLDAWPVLRELAWSRKNRWILAEEALALYERNWRFVEPERLSKTEAALIDQLKNRYGGGVLNV